MTSVLAVSGHDGAPLAALEAHLKTADGVLSTRDPALPDEHHLEQVLPLAGLWVALTMLDYLEHHDPNDLKQLVRDASLPFPILKCG